MSDSSNNIDSSFAQSLYDTDKDKNVAPSAPVLPAQSNSRTLTECIKEQQYAFDKLREEGTLKSNGVLTQSNESETDDGSESEIDDRSNYSSDVSMSNDENSVTYGNEDSGNTPQTCVHGLPSEDGNYMHGGLGSDSFEDRNSIKESQESQLPDFNTMVLNIKGEWSKIQKNPKRSFEDSAGNHNGSHECQSENEFFKQLSQSFMPMNFSLAWMLSSLSRPWTSIKFFFRALKWKIMRFNPVKFRTKIANWLNAEQEKKVQALRDQNHNTVPSQFQNPNQNGAGFYSNYGDSDQNHSQMNAYSGVGFQGYHSMFPTSSPENEEVVKYKFSSRLHLDHGDSKIIFGDTIFGFKKNGTFCQEDSEDANVTVKLLRHGLHTNSNLYSIGWKALGGKRICSFKLNTATHELTFGDKDKHFADNITVERLDDVKPGVYPQATPCNN